VPGDLPRQEDRAALALVLGLSSIVCLGPLLGIPAIVIGFVSRGRITASGGTLKGSGLALGGILAGAFGTLLPALWFAVAIGGAFLGRPSSLAAPSSPTYTPPAHAVTAPRETVDVVDLLPGTPLRAQLLREAAAASGAKKKLLVQTTATWCSPCKEIAASLQDEEMEAALAHVRLVRVDFDAFAEELPALSLARTSVPWFFLLDDHLAVKDAISADEWDENETSNVAPVLTDFVNGTLHRRRHK